MLALVTGGLVIRSNRRIALDHFNNSRRAIGNALPALNTEVTIGPKINHEKILSGF